MAESRGGFFFVIFGPSSQNERFWPKSVVWKGAQQTLSIPPAAAGGIAGAFHHGSLDHAQKAAKECPRIHALKTPPRAILLNRKNPACTWRFWQADLLVGFAADFWAWLADFGGVVRRRIFCFRLADFRRIFSADFSFAFCDQKNPPQKSTATWRSFGRFSTVGWTPDRPGANSKFSTGTLPDSGTRFVSPLLLPRLRNSWSMATAPLEIPKQAGFKPHRLTGQEIVHSKARRQAEIYTSKTRMAPPNS